MTAPQHPFAQYPYHAWHAPPGYVGPAWGAPGPHRPVPPARKSSCAGGCIAAALVGLGVLVLAAGALVIVLAVVMGAEPTTTPTPPQPPPPKGADPEVWRTGVCRDFSKERDKPVYEPALGTGSAKRLRGRVGMLHIRLDPIGGETWTRDGQLRVEQGALLAQRFYLHHAARYGVTDLKFDIVPWQLKTPVTLPPMNVLPSNRFDDATMQRLRTETRRAIETALGERLESTVDRMRRDGYDEVAMTVYFPVTSRGRAFAWFGLRSDPGNYPEVAYMFSPLRDFGEFAVTVSHEGLHLFGADDLYRTRVADPADKHDVMGEFCTGFKEATIGDTTAYAIGWRAKPPARQYGIKAR